MSALPAKRHRVSGLFEYLTLFTSFSTLLCCALPSLLVLVGLGATVAAFLSAVPWLVALSRHKGWVFLISGSMIAGNLLYVYALAPRLRTSGQACSTDAPGACETTDRMGRIILWTSATIYGAGLFSAFVLGPLLMRFG